MNALSFSNLPVIFNPTLKPLEVREKEMKQLPETDIRYRLLFTAFLGYEGILLEDYPNCLRYPVGYLFRGNLVTSKEAIVEVSKHFVREDSGMEHLDEFREHLNLYYKSLDIYPPWEIPLFREKVSSGSSVWILSGPHADSGLKPNEKRNVIYDEKRQLIYGPRI